MLTTVKRTLIGRPIDGRFDRIDDDRIEVSAHLEHVDAGDIGALVVALGVRRGREQGQAGHQREHADR